MKPSQRARQPSAAAKRAAEEASLPTPPTTKRRKTAKRPRQSIDSQRAEAEAGSEAGGEAGGEAGSEAGTEAGTEAGERTGGYEDFEPTQDGGTASGRPDQDEDEEDEAAIAAAAAAARVEALRNLRFIASVQAKRSSTTLGRVRFHLEGTDRAITKTRTWCHGVEEHDLKRMEVLLHHIGINRVEWLRNDVKWQEDFAEFEDRMLQWQEEGFQQSELTITCHMERSAPLFVDGLEDPPASQQQRRVRTAARTPRPTATQRQEARLNDDIDTLEDEAEGSGTQVRKGSELRVFWACKLPSCKNNPKGFCYWHGSDSPENHYPLTDEIVKAWAREWQAGRLTKDHPNVDILHLMRKARERLYAGRHNHTPVISNSRHSFMSPSPSQPFNFNLVFSKDGLPQSFSQLPGSAPQNEPDQDLGDDGEPPSSQTPAIDLLDECFCELADGHHWQGEAESLEGIRVAVRSEGYDLAGILQMSVSDWQDLGLKKGYLLRVQSGIRRFMCKRKRR
ncbi:hypothetical protein KC361_g9337 [Hortaea werneckii]|nr:hypothetical protein KC361_g9337 [Hortaea werneckii]